MFSLLGCSALVYKSAIASAWSSRMHGEGSCPQREQKMLSDSPPALIGCFDLGAVDSSKWPQRQQVEPEEPDCFHRLSHVLLSGQRDSFSKYD